MPANPAIIVWPRPASGAPRDPGGGVSASTTQPAVSGPPLNVARTRYPAAHAA